MDLPQFALSVRQPWAWAIIHAGKDIENRSAAAVRHGMGPGRLAIHASKGMTMDEYEDAGSFILDTAPHVRLPRPDHLVRGGIIGAVTVTDVVKDSESPWFFGPRGLVLAEPVAVTPIPAPGALGYFAWSAGGELDAPKPWMTAWPDAPRRRPRHLAQPGPMPLFED